MGKSLAGAIGDVNLHGKKEKALGCGCCTARDLRDTKERRRVLREVRNMTADEVNGWKCRSCDTIILEGEFCGPCGRYWEDVRNGLFDYE